MRYFNSTFLNYIIYSLNFNELTVQTCLWAVVQILKTPVLVWIIRAFINATVSSKLNQYIQRSIHLGAKGAFAAGEKMLRGGCNI